MNRVRQFVGYCCAFVVCSSGGLSQAKTPNAGQDNLYAMALFASIDEMAREWGHFDDSSGNKTRTNYHRMIVEKNQITEKLPERSGEYDVEYLSAPELIERYHKVRKEFAILVVFPMTNEGTHLKIGINKYWFKFKNRVSNFALEGGSEVEFRYDCANQAWIVDHVKSWGI